MSRIELAGCVIQNAAGNILMIHRNTAKRVQWEIPGGKVDRSEKPAEAAVREVREELGVEVQVIRELGGAPFQEDGHAMNYGWFLAEIVNGTPSVQESDVHDRYEYVSVRRMARMSHQLSANARNFLDALILGTISIP